MWIFALEGFVSVVAVRGSADRLLVRGRVREDVEHWRQLVGGRQRLMQTPAADYRWRFMTTRARLARAFAKMIAEGIRYDNFKRAVGHDDQARARAYLEVWASMFRLQQSV